VEVGLTRYDRPIDANSKPSMAANAKSKDSPAWTKGEQDNMKTSMKPVAFFIFSPLDAQKQLR
jgi:hypothetical protein